MIKFKNRLLISVTILALLLHIFNKAVIFLNFQLHRQYIAQNLCEKKSEVANTCKGTCHLNKELDKQEKKEQTPGNSSKEKYEIQMISEVNSIGLYNHEVSISGNPAYYFCISETTLQSIFHPPKV